MKKFFEKHGYDTALAICGILFGGSIVGLFNDVLAALELYPWAVAACCGLSFIGGLGISAIADRRAVKIAKIQEDGETARLELQYTREDEIKAAEAEELRRLEEESKLAEWEKRLDRSEAMFRGEKNAEKKVFAVALYGRADHMARIGECWIPNIQLIDRGFGSGSWTEYFEFEKFGQDVVHLTLTDWLKCLFEERPDILNGFSKTAIDKANKEIDEWKPCEEMDESL